MQVTILYQDRDIIVAAKPAGMASQPDRSPGMDLQNWLRNTLLQKEGQVPEIMPVHRLDRPVGGVIVYARNRKAAAGLSAQLTDGRMQKEYIAVLTGRPEEGEPVRDSAAESRESPDPGAAGPGPEKGAAGYEPGEMEQAEPGRQWYRLTARIVREQGKNRSRAGQAEGKEAVLFYSVLDEKAIQGSTFSLVAVRLQTGRHHQIRVQMARAGAAIWGDTKYNPLFTGKKGWYDLALFARQLSFAHPRSGRRMCFTLPAPAAITAHFPAADEVCSPAGDQA